MCACAESPTALTPSSSLRSDLSAPKSPKCVSCRGAAATQSRQNSRNTQSKCNCTRVYLWEAAVLFQERHFFVCYPENEGPFLLLCTSTDTMKNKDIYTSPSIFLTPSVSHTYTHTHSLSFSLSVAAAAACLPVCLFLEAHNMADMCFVIVGTTSSLLAYKGRLLPPPPPPPHPTQNNTAALKIYHHKIKVVIIT